MNGRLSILYIGEELYADTLFPSYLRREIGRLGLRIHCEERLAKLEAQLPLQIQRALQKREDLLVVASQEEFTLVGRILSTLLDDTLHLEGSMLLPSRAVSVEEGSYLLSHEGRRINILHASPRGKLPPILLEPVGKRTFHLFCQEPALPEELVRMVLEERENIECIELLPGWFRLELYGQEHLSRLESRLWSWRERMIQAEEIVDALIGYFAYQKKSVTFAESCTGGLLAAAFTSRSGASEILEGSFVSYANRIKSEWLGVKEQTLSRYGAVSEACVLEMAHGAQKASGAQLAVAISGIAGPTGAVPQKPVGTVFVCLRDGQQSHTKRLQLEGDRNAIQQQAVLHVLKMIVESQPNIFDYFSKNP